MTEISFDELPYHIQRTFIEKQTEMLIDMIDKAGLINEFYEFFRSIDPLDIKSYEDVCTQFAEKYPDKFHIVPKKDRYDKIIVCEIDRT